MFYSGFGFCGFFSSQLFTTEAFVKDSSNDEKDDDNAPYEDAQEPSVELAGEVVAVLHAAAIVVNHACLIDRVPDVVGSVLYSVGSVFEDIPCLEMALVLFRNK